MSWTKRLERLVPDLSSVFLRFPIPAAISFLLCAWLNISGISSNHDGRVMVGAAAAFVAAGCMHLLAEGRKLPHANSFAIALVIAVPAGLAGYLPEIFRTNALFLLSGLVPLLMVAPYLRSGVNQGAIWLFNLRFGLAVLLAAVVGILFATGLSAVIAALDQLFGIPAGNLYEHVWATSLSLVAPLYGLSLMPRELDEEIDISPHTGSLIDRGISVLVNYVAVPVIAIYALILHAYAVKILVEGDLPKGQIATMVSIFAIGGTATWLVAWPWRDQGTRLLRLFMRGWFFLLVVPAILLSIAIWRRLLDYGVTPDRYGIALVAVWVAALVLYLAFRRNRADMRAILGAMGVLLVVGSLGPFGANGLTVSSQFNRLVLLLENNGVLKEGKLETKGMLPNDAASAGNSIIYALNDAGGLDRLKPWFADDANSPFTADKQGRGLVYVISERLGFNQPVTSPDYVSFNANQAMAFEFAQGGRILGPFTALQVYNSNAPLKPLTARIETILVTISLESETLRIEQKELLEAARRALEDMPGLTGPIAIELKPGVTLLIDQIYGNLSATPPLSSLRFWIIQRP